MDATGGDKSEGEAMFINRGVSHAEDTMECTGDENTISGEPGDNVSVENDVSIVEDSNEVCDFGVVCSVDPMDAYGVKGIRPVPECKGGKFGVSWLVS